ncbi:complex I subunit 4 family protein [Chryseosolibacter indicus]|uniref:NADH-quinone oxidoreductase subunit M n=1 Tax=Chryseosolibacter indicus TaxID=2782351 RepID=A0ABS5VLC3_9BACT|nr:NADH-quinone oxidoreductase subunit M [Chryseosolibacter indicus]MBT1702255.1 NADH-quinone oxidoreductase subunit M [Chryseosolibacter indicus]
MLTAVLIFWPFVAALIVLALNSNQAKGWALTASLIELVLSIYVAFQFQPTAEAQFEINTPWIASLGINFHVAIDGISLLLVLLTTVLTPFIVLSSFNHNYEKANSFYSLILFMEMALVGVFVALDGFLFYIFWEMALIPIYFICLRWGGINRGAVTLKFFIYTLAGSLVMLLGFIYLYYQTPGSHSFDIKALYAAGQSLSEFDQRIIFWAIFIAFAVKMPVFPFHTWQPDTYNTAPTQGTMLLSGIMLKMGIYGVIRWLIPVVPGGVAIYGNVALIISVIGIVYASCLAIVQKDLKRLIAYSSIAHVGLIAAGLFTMNKLGMQGAIIQMVSHGFIIVGLFYVIDIIISRTATQEISNLGGIRNIAPVFTTVFVIIMLGNVSLPLTSGFVGEFLLINSVFQYNYIIGAVAGLTMILGAVYMLRSFQQTMLGETNSNTRGFIDLGTTEKLVLFPIVAIIIFIGVYPAPLLKISEAAVDNLYTIISSYQALKGQ